ncbi:MAG: LTA synthase family protein [Oligoflexus sp.]
MYQLQRFGMAMLGLLLAYQLLRMGFWLNNAELFHAYPVIELLMAFVHGLRFDLAALAMINAPLALWVFFDGRQQKDRWTKRLQRFVFISLNGLFIAINLFDVEYFQFTGRRLTFAAFDMKDDLAEQFFSLASSYWYLSLTAFIFIVGLVYLSRALLVKKRLRFNWLEFGLVNLVVVALIVILARGGWQAKPLIAANAFLDSRPQKANLILNSSFTLLKSVGSESLPAIHHFPNWESVERVLTPLQARPKEAVKDLQKPNVVVIILESFGREYMGWGNPYKGYTPFLDELASRSTFYPQHFANGRRSIDAIPAIIAGIPAWMDKPFITSPYQTNRIEGLPNILAQHGYRSYFFHGGYSGTMFFDVMARLLGFDQYIDASSYPQTEHHDGTWGIFDEPFFKFAADRLSQSPQPFFSTIFTLSSHHPYRIPDEYHGQFPQGSLDIHESIGYADYALKQFFNYIQDAPWYENTIFVITADHTSKSNQTAYQTELGQFRVPLLIFHPGNPLTGLDSSAVSQHIDIKPTILDLLGLEDSPISLQGQSLVSSEGQDRLSLLYFGQIYLGVTDKWILRYHLQNRQLEAFALEDERLAQALNLDEEVEDLWRQRIEAYIQLFHNGLIEDRLISKNIENF